MNPKAACLKRREEEKGDDLNLSSLNSLPSIQASLSNLSNVLNSSSLAQNTNLNTPNSTQSLDANGNNWWMKR